MLKSKLENLLAVALIFLLITGWIFSGWPQIWKNPSIPPKIQEVLAATFILKSANSDLAGSGADFDKEISTGTETAGTITVLVAGGTTETSYAYTVADVPDNADWETGGMTVEVNVTVENANIFLELSASRVDSSGALQETSSPAEEQLLDAVGVKTFDIPSTDWNVGNCGDRIRINYIFRNSHPQQNRSVDIQTGTTDTEHTTSITQGGGGCAPVVSISISPTSTDYGAMDISQVKKAPTENANDEFIVTNTGNVAETFDVIGTDATGGTGWTLSTTSVGSSIFMHAYSALKTLAATTTLGSDESTEWVALDKGSNYKTLAINVATSSTADLVLELLTPSSVSDYVQKNITVTVRATEY